MRPLRTIQTLAMLALAAALGSGQQATADRPADTTLARLSFMLKEARTTLGNFDRTLAGVERSVDFEWANLDRLNRDLLRGRDPVEVSRELDGVSRRVSNTRGYVMEVDAGLPAVNESLRYILDLADQYQLHMIYLEAAQMMEFANDVEARSRGDFLEIEALEDEIGRLRGLLGPFGR